MQHDTSWLWGVAPDHWLGLGLALLTLAFVAPVGGVVRFLAVGGNEHALRWLRRRGRSPAAVRLAALLTLASGAMHLGVAPHHLGEHPGRGLLVVLDAALLLAIGALLPERRRARRAWALLLVANILIYGVLVGAGAEHSDQAGAVTKLAELTALALLLLTPRAGARPGALRATLASAGVIATGLVLGALLWAVQFTHTEAHDLASVTPAKRQAADALLAETRAGIARFADQGAARAAGYRPVALGDSGATHWENKAYQRDGRVLDPTRPEELVYAATPQGPLLLGAAYVMPRPRQRGPQPGGALTRWHNHPVCLTPLPPFLTSLVSPFGACPPLSLSAVMPEMLHVWVVPTPGGPFAADLDQEFVRALGR